jgi:hypothetical protein
VPVVNNLRGRPGTVVVGRVCGHAGAVRAVVQSVDCRPLARSGDAPHRRRPGGSSAGTRRIGDTAHARPSPIGDGVDLPLPPARHGDESSSRDHGWIGLIIGFAPCERQWLRWRG